MSSLAVHCFMCTDLGMASIKNLDGSLNQDELSMLQLIAQFTHKCRMCEFHYCDKFANEIEKQFHDLCDKVDVTRLVALRYVTFHPEKVSENLLPIFKAMNLPVERQAIKKSNDQSVIQQKKLRLKQIQESGYCDVPLFDDDETNAKLVTNSANDEPVSHHESDTVPTNQAKQAPYGKSEDIDPMLQVATGMFIQSS